MAIDSRIKHEDVFSDKDAGNHHVLWYRTDQGKARGVAEFLRSGLRDGNLLAIVLPLRELQLTERALIEENFPIERLMKEGRLLLFASEELLPGHDGDYARIKDALAVLQNRAKAEGRNLCLVGRVAPVLFERGDIEGALAVELAADSSLGQSRLLCLYDARERQKLPARLGDKIDELHTRSYDEMPSGSVRIRAKRKKSPTQRSTKTGKN